MDPAPSASAVDSSLEGVVVARTSIAHVDGRRGLALIRGYPLHDLAAKRTFEDISHAVLVGDLPSTPEASARFSALLTPSRGFTPADAAALATLTRGRPHAEALVVAAPLAEDEASRAEPDPTLRVARVLGRLPAVCALVRGVTELPLHGGYARRALVALGATRSDAAATRAVEVMLNLECEHGLAASTFAARVAASSGASPGVCLAAAIATLAGPRHGGATSEARSMLLEALESGNAEAYVRERHARRARLPGFGHRVYKVADPRVPPLREALRGLGEARLLPVAETLDRVGGELYGPKGVYANIDLYNAVLLDALGVDPQDFVAAFALGLACGWLAHWVEQRAQGRLIRPESVYAGPAQRPVP